MASLKTLLLLLMLFRSIRGMSDALTISGAAGPMHCGYK
jgi:hypothetical protein